MLGESTIDANGLKGSSDIFKRLSKGFHFCQDDKEYKILSDHYSEFRLLYSLVGFDLYHDPNGFFYFRPGGEDESSKKTWRAVCLIGCLIDSLADSNLDPYAVMFEKGFGMDLITSISESHRDILAAIDFPDEKTIDDYIRRTLVDSYGFFGKISDRYIGRVSLRRITDPIMEIGEKTMEEGIEE